MGRRCFGETQHLASFEIRPLNSNDAENVVAIMRGHWGSTRIVSKGKMYYPEKLQGFVATLGDESVGLVTYEIKNRECEVVTLNSSSEGLGIGS